MIIQSSWKAIGWRAPYGCLKWGIYTLAGFIKNVTFLRVIRGTEPAIYLILLWGSIEHSIWHSFWQSIWHPFWHFFGFYSDWQYGVRRSLQLCENLETTLTWQVENKECTARKQDFNNSNPGIFLGFPMTHWYYMGHFMWNFPWFLVIPTPPGLHVVQRTGSLRGGSMEDMAGWMEIYWIIYIYIYIFNYMYIYIYRCLPYISWLEDSMS